MDIDYKKLYNETLQKLYEMVSKGIITEEVAKDICADFAVESEDEKIRQFFIHEVEGTSEEIMSYRGMNKESVLAWLKKQGEQKPIGDINGEDYGIDGLWHAQRILEKTLGGVEGYQSDDGILEHKCAITAVRDLAKKQGEQKPIEYPLCKTVKDKIDYYIVNHFTTDTVVKTDVNSIVKAMKEGVMIGMSEQKPTRPAWSEEDEDILNTIINHFKVDIECTDEDDMVRWLKSVKDRILSQPKPEQNK